MDHPVAWGSVQVALAAVDSRPVVVPVVGRLPAVTAKAAAAVVVVVGSVDRQAQQLAQPQQALMYLCCCCRRNRSRF